LVGGNRRASETTTRTGLGGVNGLKIIKGPWRATSLIVLIHGWGGGPRTWANLAEVLSTDADLQSDVGVFEYVSGLGRLLTLAGAEVYDLAQQLADEIRDSAYETVELVGHSMGGIIARHVVKRLYDGEGFPYTSVRKVGALGLFAVPLDGVGLVAHITPRSDARALAANTQTMGEVDTFFLNKVQIDDREISTTKEIVLPCYSVIGTSDRIVPRRSSTHGIPSHQRKSVGGGHRAVAKVGDAESKTYIWLRNKLLQSRSQRPAMLRTLASRNRQDLIVSIDGPKSDQTWNRAFELAVDVAQRTHSVKVVARAAFDGDSPDLRIIIISDASSKSITEAASTLALKDERDSPRLLVALCEAPTEDGYQGSGLPVKFAPNLSQLVFVLSEALQASMKYGRSLGPNMIDDSGGAQRLGIEGVRWL
jgi:pimeloyl-ACP methyl ester carboxylesterase